MSNKFENPKEGPKEPPKDGGYRIVFPLDKQENNSREGSTEGTQGGAERSTDIPGQSREFSETKSGARDQSWTKFLKAEAGRVTDRLDEVRHEVEQLIEVLDGEDEALGVIKRSRDFALECDEAVSGYKLSCQSYRKAGPKPRMRPPPPSLP